MKKVLLLCLGLLACTPAWALREYYSLTRSIRSLGMGGAFYGLSDDEYALFYNPAGLSLYRGEGQFMFNITPGFSNSSIAAVNKIRDLGQTTTSNIVTTLSEFQGKPIYVNAGLFPHYVRKHFAVGLLLADVKGQLAVLGRDFDTSLDVTMMSDTALVIGYGRSVFDDNLHLGLNLKGVLRAGGKRQFSILEIAQGNNFNLSPSELGGTGAGIDFDLGAIYDLPELPYGLASRVSLTFTNMLASSLPMARVDGQPPVLQRMLSLGTHTVFPGVGWIDNFHVLVDFAEFRLGGEADDNFGARTGSFWKHVNLGVEAPMNRWFILRSGFHQGNLTFGLGVHFAAMKLDLVTYEEELGVGVGRLSSRRFALRLAIGAGSVPPPIIDRDDALGRTELHKIEIRETPRKPPQKLPENLNPLPAEPAKDVKDKDAKTAEPPKEEPKKEGVTQPPGKTSDSGVPNPENPPQASTPAEEATRVPASETAPAAPAEAAPASPAPESPASVDIPSSPTEPAKP